MASTPVLNYILTFVSLTGLGLSIYTYILELNLENNSKYEAMCDISEQISCTKAIKSPYGKGFGIASKDSFFYKPNSLLGIIYYSLLATLTQSQSTLITKLSYWSTFVANLSSVYLGYIMYFKLQTLCVICISTYVVNALCLIFFNVKLRKLLTEDRINAAKKSS